MIERQRSMRLCQTALLFTIATHAYAEASAKTAVTTLLDGCLDTVVAGDAATFDDLARSRPLLDEKFAGWDQAFVVTVDDRDVIVGYAVSDMTGRTCTVFSESAEKSAQPLTWGEIRRDVLSWHSALIAGGGWQNATRSSDRDVGVAAVNCTLEQPLFLFAQPVWQMFGQVLPKVETDADRLALGERSTEASFQFLFHELSTADCLLTLESAKS